MLPAAEESARPTNVRFYVLGATFVIAFLLYLHRFCMSYAQTYIREDLGLTDDQIGYCFSAFFFSYALAQVPSGWLSDRFGARMMLALYVLIWSFFTAAMGWTFGFASLLLVRLAAGIGQAGAYPTSASLIGRWVPVSVRGTASGFVAWGGRLGGGLAPLLTSVLIVAFIPIETPATLSPDDILDAERLARSLNEAVAKAKPADFDEHGPATERGWRVFFYHVVQGTLDSSGKPAAAWVVAEPTTIYEKQISGDRSGEKASADVVDTLNHFVRDMDVPRADPRRNLPLEREGRLLYGRNSLTTAERQRLQRLILEAAFPESIRKIYVHGWRQVMWAFGSCGIGVALLFWIVFRNRPSKHPNCNAAELALISQGRLPLQKEIRDAPPQPSTTRGYDGSPQPSTAGKYDGSPQPSSTTETKLDPPPMRAILTSRSLWLMCVSQWGSNVGWVFLVTWLPRYLAEEHQVPLIERGWMCAVPLWIGWAGMLLGGKASDAAVARFGLRWGRIMPMAFGRFTAMAAYLACFQFAPTPWMLAALFGVVAFSTDLGSASGWAYKQDVGGRHIGSIHGWANMWGNLGATVSPILLQLVVKQIDWNAAFLVCAAAFCISGLATLGVDATIPIASSERSEGKSGKEKGKGEE